MQVLILVSLLIYLPGCWTGLPNRQPRQVTVPRHIAKAALDVALSVQGAPYVWGGRGPEVFDCSGLITWAYKQAVGRETIFLVGSRRTNDAIMHDLWRFDVELLPKDAAAPGDIVFITNTSERITHGGLFIRWLDEEKTAFEFINASSYEEYRAVVIDWWPVDDVKRGQWLVGIGRLKICID
ncbi:MAG TPA: C40 family peptidase [Firmicutes bacterium]|nr:C40 family peptidase [Bacillota bacterium]